MRSSTTPPRTSSREKSTTSSEWTVEPAVQGNAALSNALQAAKDAGVLEGDVHYFGTLGFPTDTLSKSKRDGISDHLENDYSTHAVFVTDKDFDGHYAHFCKIMLWPLFNYQVPDHPKSKAYADHSWDFYVKVNQAFADSIVHEYKHGDSIWIHDYHLLLVPGMIRKQLPDARIGFFLHTAFPSSEVFRCLAMRKQLLEGMLGANLIVFQAHEYVRHFKQTCSRILLSEATESGVHLQKRFTSVSSTPIGAVPKDLLEARQDPDAIEWTKTLLDKYTGKCIIASLDKLDRIRGVKQKLLAYEHFLETSPEWRENVVFIQVATSTAGEDKDNDAAISEVVTRINARFSTLSYSPIVFLRQDIAFPQYLALLTAADVLMVTPLRDGMNLTCHDFIACQDGRGATEKKHGPMILSEFTGSSEIFHSYDIAVNPWDVRQMDRAIKFALNMNPTEKERRYNALASIVHKRDAPSWFGELQTQLSIAYDENQSRDTHSIPRLPLKDLADNYCASKTRLFILDCEGTLVEESGAQIAYDERWQRVVHAIYGLLSSSENNVVYATCGRTTEDLDALFEQIPEVGLIAENGCFVRPFAKSDWIELAGDVCLNSKNWKEGVLDQLNYYKERIEGSFIEERKCSIVFHYGKAADPEGAARQAGEMANHMNDSCEPLRMKAVPANKRVFIEPRDVNKATATEWVLKDLLNPQGVNVRSRRAASSTTEDYFTGSPPMSYTEETGPPSPTPTDNLSRDAPALDVTEATPKAGDFNHALPAALHTISERSNSDSVDPSRLHPNSLSMPDFLMVAGNDRDDETSFGWANRLSDRYLDSQSEGIKSVYTVCIGKKNTQAKYTLTQGAAGK